MCAHQAISAGIYNYLLFIDIDAFREKTHVLRTYPEYRPSCQTAHRPIGLLRRAILGRTRMAAPSSGWARRAAVRPQRHRTPASVEHAGRGVVVQQGAHKDGQCFCTPSCAAARCAAGSDTADGLTSERASRALSIEKRAGEEPIRHRDLKWVVRHPSGFVAGGSSLSQKRSLFGIPNLSHNRTIVPAPLYLLYPPLLPLLDSRNLLVYPSLPTNIPGWHAMVRRRKDDTCVGTAARGIVA
jgi:hypothetical protein